ncbi:MAG: tetratricopeptide repeat protein [Prosthecobacter sp.]|uniref:tetratricopeptide repeat protein n=1 Tax=Prosthecobacter sp. TaxID=1965333 RepID=UPI003901AAD9
MRPFRIFILAAWCAALSVSRAQTMAEGQLDAQTVEEMTLGFNRGMAAFGNKEWLKAMEEMEKVIAMVDGYPDKKAMEAPKQKLAPVYYTVGAAAFNVPDFPKAITSFSRFVAEFPKHEKVAEARLAVARATYSNKEYDKAAQLFAEMEQYPSIREQSLAIQAQCFKETGKLAEMEQALSKLTAGGINNTVQANGALLLAQARAEAGKVAELEPLIDQLVARRQFVENVVALNSLIVAVGDSLAEKEQFEKASRTYLKVLPPAEVIAFQKQRIEFLERRIAANEQAAARSPQASVTLLGQNAEFAPVLEQARTLLTEFEKLPDYMPGLMLRSSRCWYGRDKKWESILVSERLMQRYPTAVKEREAALFSCVIGYADVMQVKTCQQLCAQYLKEFPEGANAGTVAYVQGAVALQAGDVKGAASLFGTLIDVHPGSTFIDQMYLMLGSAHFSLGELDDALRTYQKYITKFPKGPALEEAKYRAAIIPVFQGKYEAGWKTVEAFLKAHPRSQYAEDAKYRLMICKYAANLYAEVIADAAKWAKEHPGGIMEPEVLSLKGDCLAALEKNKEAADTFQLAAKKAATDEVMNYALNEASRLLQKLGDMAQLSKMWEQFIKDKPDHSSVVAGIYWISKAKTKEGKVDEAKQIITEQLKRSLNAPKNESVEMLLQQLAQLCWKRPRAKTPPAEAVQPVLVSSAAEPPPPPPWDAMGELEKQIAPLEASADASGRPRLQFVRVELLRLLKKNTEADDLMSKIAVTKPEALSPQLLALAGEYLQSKKLTAEAAVLYNHLKDTYLKSPWLDYAYTGLGAMALAKGDAKTALDHYTLAADEYAGAKAKESTLGRAIALLEVGRYSEAKKLFEQVASTREWRGESTAQAVYYLGEVEERQKRLPEAVAFYQRVFVAYQKYLPWVEKAYIKAAQCFDQLGKRKEATAHLQEVLRHEKIGFETKTQARKMLQQWGVAS